jgi:hypothetical protein
MRFNSADHSTHAKTTTITIDASSNKRVPCNKQWGIQNQTELTWDVPATERASLVKATKMH